MALSNGSNEGLVIVKDNEVDLTRASYSENLSSTDLEEDSQAFHVTMDRVRFQTPVDIIGMVLEANGYLVNLENILACIDDFRLGVKVQVKKLSGSTVVAKNFIPCVQFRLPQKSKIGPTLQRFYSEIEVYENRLAELHKQPLKKGPRTKSPDDLKEQIKKLEAENKNLRAENSELRTQLTRMSKAEASANKALVSQNIMPPNIRLAKVRDLNLRERIIVLKAGRTNINFPMFLSPVIPEIEDKCLVYIEKGQTLGGFFYETKGRDISPGRGQVLWADENNCKIRDPQRKVWLLTAKHDAEREMYKSLKRGDHILLYMLEGQIIRLQKMNQDSGPVYEDRVLEALAKHQLYLNSQESKK